MKFDLIVFYLAIDDDWGVDVGTRESIADGIEIRLKGSGWVANWNAVVGESRVFFLQSFHNLAKGDKFLNFKFALLLAYINNFEFAIGLSSAFNNFDEFFFIGFYGGTFYKKGINVRFKKIIPVEIDWLRFSEDLNLQRQQEFVSPFFYFNWQP